MWGVVPSVRTGSSLGHQKGVMTMLEGSGAVLTGIAAIVSAFLLGAPSGVRAYIDLQTYRDKRKKKRLADQPRAIPDTSPPARAVTKRSA